MLDLEFVRGQFPAFSEPSLKGWAFFENAGGSYTCKQVIERLNHFYQCTKVQPYGPYPASAAAGCAMDESYTRLAEYLNVKPDEVNFGPSTTQNTYVLAHAFSAGWEAGDEIIVTNQDHEANSGAWRKLSRQGIIINEWKIDPDTGMLDINLLDNILSNKTRLVAFPHCSNIVGHVNPVSKICAKAKSVGATTVVDGVSYAGHGLPDVDALGADIYLFSMYKIYGPHQGIMVVRSNTLELLENQSHFFNESFPQKKVVPAGPDHAQIAAASGVADYFDLLHRHHFPSSGTVGAQRGKEIHDLFRAHEHTLLKPLLEFLTARNDLRILGPTDASIRTPTVALEVRGSADDLSARLAKHKIMCWNGNFYAYRLIEAMGLDVDQGALRISFVHYTSPDEIEQLINALDQEL